MSRRYIGLRLDAPRMNGCHSKAGGVARLLGVRTQDSLAWWPFCTRLGEADSQGS